MSELLIKAEKDLYACKLIIKDNSSDYAIDLVCYHLQQSIEKSLKFCLESEGVRYQFTHDIEILLRQLEDNHIHLDCIALLGPFAGTLTNWESKSRYLDGFTTTISNVNLAMTIAESLIVEIKSRYIPANNSDNSSSITDA